MSFTACAWAFKVRDLQASYRHILLVLANYADERGMCWPSQKHLADATGYSERTVRTALGFLEESGYIDRRGRRDDTQTYRSDEIYLCMPAEMIDANPKMKASGKSFRSQRQSLPAPAANNDNASGNDFQDQRQSLPADQRQPLPPILSDSILSEDTITDTDDSASVKLPAGYPEDAFEQFWKKYPRKVGKGNARRAFGPAARKVAFDVMMKGLDTFIESLKSARTEAQYCAHATTWLNGERWGDEHTISTFKNRDGELRARRQVAI